MVGRTIKGVKCADDRIVYFGSTPQTVACRLRNRAVQAVRRKGKYIWFVLEKPPHPVFHFGMTGSFKVPGGSSIQLQSGPREDHSTQHDWPPRFWKIHLTTDTGSELVMTNARRLGQIRLLNDPENEPPISRLGFDPLLNLPPAAKMYEQLSRRKATIKGVLLDQSFAAGVGNWIADEILYQTKIAPTRRASDFSIDEVRAIRRRMKLIIEKAVAVNAEKKRYPRTWLFHHRWGESSNARTAKGEPIQHITVAGRTTAWVPAVQK